MELYAFLIVLFFLAAVPAVDSYQCETTYLAHEVFAQASHKLNLTSDGPRQLTANAYTVGCPTYPYTPTGSSYTGETALTLNVSTRDLPTRCRAVESDDGMLKYTSFQAAVLRTPGWTITPRRFRLRDVDAHDDGAAGWTETAGVFGLHSGALVTPILYTADSTALSKADAVLTAADAKAMGLDVEADIMFPAVKGGDTDCALTNTTACEASYDFEKPIDTLVVMLSATDKKVDPEHPRAGNMTGILLGPVVTRCGCRCHVKDLGTRSVHSPAGADGECTRKSTSAPVTQCADDGPNWCDKKFSVGYTGSGALLPNGNVRCSPVERTQAKFVQVSFHTNPNRLFITDTNLNPLPQHRNTKRTTAINFCKPFRFFRLVLYFFSRLQFPVSKILPPLTLHHSLNSLHDCSSKSLSIFFIIHNECY